MPDSINVRPATRDDLPFLWEMLFEAAAVNEQIREMGIEKALALPAIFHILNNFGRRGDFGFVAESFDKELVGAIWARFYPEEDKGYGFVSADIPELAVAVVEQFRGRGVGAKLLERLIKASRDLNFPGLSLSVDRRNPAVRLYERFGFADAGISDKNDSSVTMLLRL